MIPTLGTTCLALLLPVALYSGGMTIIGARYADERLHRSGLHASYATLGLLTAAAVLLVMAFVGNHFEMLYVAGHSNRTLPLFYKITGLWSGLDGSLLFWAWLLAIMGFFGFRRLQRELPQHAPYMNAAIMIITAFFAMILVFQNNPFATSLEVPFDGRGLNPLLQAPEMVIHPPMLYLGYVSASLPFAIVMAGLCVRRCDGVWLREVRRWVIFCWLFLSVGNLLGMYWAYVELGWGGFWAWDPVENAAIMPWFTATAMVHSMIVEERRGMLRRWNATLALLTFLLTIFGTFLTRSGVVQSVHAFSNSTLGAYFGSFLMFCIVAGSAMLVWRRGDLVSENRLHSIFAKEGTFLLNNVFLTVGCFAILWGTMLPTVTEWLVDERLTLGPAFFNQVLAPFGLILLFLAGLGPVVGWRRAPGVALWHRLRVPIALGLIALAAGWWGGMREWFALAATTCGTFTLVVTLGEFARGLRVVRDADGSSLLQAPVAMFRRAQRRYGGYVVHIGMLLIMAGFVGAIYSSESNVHLGEGEHFAVRGYTLAFEGLRYKADDHKEAVAGALRVSRGGKEQSLLLPARYFYRRSEQPTTEVAIHHALTHDLYAVLGSFSVEEKSADFKITHNPLVSCIWWGGLLLVLGTLIVVWPRPKNNAVTRGAAIVVILCSLVGFSGLAHAQIPEDQSVISAAKRLACLCGDCARINLAECPCGFADERRAEILGLIRGGQTSDMAVLSMVDRYGETVLATSPLLGWKRFILWTPMAIGGAAVFVLLIVLRRRQTVKISHSRAGGNPEEA